MSSSEFRRIGYQLVDRVAKMMDDIPGRPVLPAETGREVREALNAARALPEDGSEPGLLLERAADLLMNHSLFNGHPRFFGYITSSPAPIGMLGDFLAAAVNPNCGGWALAPMASEIEAQTVRWIAEFIGFDAKAGGPASSIGGLLVSGGNMANFVCLLAARTAKAGWDVRTKGLGYGYPPLTLYASAETHTWIQKAADMFGFGTEAIRWIPVDSAQRMKTDELRRQIETDRRNGLRPFFVVGTAGSVSTGATDPLVDIAAVCRENEVWFHVDGAYGALAAGLPAVPADLRGLVEADSVAVDPHKWLYSPLEAGCVLVRRAEDLRNAFSYHPPYYRFGDEVLNFVDFGPQNSRGFRALKVWLSLQQLGRAGYAASIAEDIRLSRKLAALLAQHADFEVFTQNLSITTFRYVPAALRSRLGEPEIEQQLNMLNEELRVRIEQSGRAFFSNAVIDGKFALRACIVNFRTTDQDIEAIPSIVGSIGAEMARG